MLIASYIPTYIHVCMYMYVVCTVCMYVHVCGLYYGVCPSIDDSYGSYYYVSVQVERAELRLEGVRYLLEVTGQSGLLSSVQYAALCGWLGLGNATGRYIHCVEFLAHGGLCTVPLTHSVSLSLTLLLSRLCSFARHHSLVFPPPLPYFSHSMPKSHYLSGVEHIPPDLRTRLELELQRMQHWVVGKLRQSVWQAQLALKRGKAARKIEGMLAVTNNGLFCTVVLVTLHSREREGPSHRLCQLHCWSVLLLEVHHCSGGNVDV